MVDLTEGLPSLEPTGLQKLGKSLSLNHLLEVALSEGLPSLGASRLQRRYLSQFSSTTQQMFWSKSTTTKGSKLSKPGRWLEVQVLWITKECVRWMDTMRSVQGCNRGLRIHSKKGEGLTRSISKILRHWTVIYTWWSLNWCFILLKIKDTGAQTVHPGKVDLQFWGFGMLIYLFE